MDKELTINITAGTIIKALALIVLAGALWYLRDLVLIVLISIVIGSAVDPAARSLAKYKIPRTLSISVVYLAFFASFFVVMYFFVPPVLKEASGLITTLPTSVHTLESNANSTLGIPFIDSFSLSSAVNELNGLFTGLTEDAFAMINVVFGGLISFVLVVVFSFYFAVNERGIEDFLRVVTPLKSEKHVVDLWHRSQKKIGLWLQGQLLLGLIVGVLVYLGLTILGIEYALVLAVLAALLELIPVFGPILAMVPAVALGFSSGGFALAGAVFVFYIIIQQFENNLIYPLVVTKVVGVPPLLVILALIIGAKLAGIIGILLSIPMAAIVQELFADMDKSRRAALKKQNA
mgnify:CR=1 FL=1